MKDLLRTLMKAAIWAIVLVIIGMAVFYFSQGYFVYSGRALYRGEDPEWQARIAVVAARGFRTSQMESSDPGVTVHGLWGPAQGVVPAILWFHDRRENITEIGHELQPLIDLGCHVYAMEYRGYGMSPGVPTEEALLKDAETVFDHLWARDDVRPRQVFVGGYSMGAALALRLANKKDVAGVIAIAPIGNLSTAMKKHLKYIPTDLLLRDQYDAKTAAKGARGPVFIAHGTIDDEVPLSTAKALAAFAPTSTLYEVEGAGHNDIYSVGGKKLWEEIDTFIVRISR